MSREESRSVLASPVPPAAAASGMGDEAAGSAEIIQNRLEQMKKDIFKAVVQDALREAPPTHIGTSSDGATELEWLGGELGLRTIVLRRVCFNPPMDGDALKVPVDAAIVGKAAGRETHGMAAGPEQQMEESKMKKVTISMGQLQPEGPDTNWEQWFQAFEQEARRLSIPLEQWPKLLEWQSSPIMQPFVLARVGECVNLFGIPPRLVYGAVRDSLLGGSTGKYGAWSYLQRLFSVETGARSARDLANYLTMLARDYEAARKRAAARLERFPEISGATLARIYYKALAANTRERVPKPEEVVRDPQTSRFDKVVAAAVEYEAGLPFPTSRPANVAGVFPPRGRGPRGSKRQPEGETRGKNNVIKRQKRTCYFCGVDGHSLCSCGHWKQWTDENQHRRSLCAKCHEPGHRTNHCPEKVGKFWAKYRARKVEEENKEMCGLVYAPRAPEEGKITPAPQSPPSLPALLSNVASALELERKALHNTKAPENGEAAEQTKQETLPAKKPDRIAAALAMLQTPSSGARTPVSEEDKDTPTVALVATVPTRERALTASAEGAKRRSLTPEAVKRSRLLAEGEPELEEIAELNPHVKRTLERALNGDRVNGPYTLYEQRVYDELRRGCKMVAIAVDARYRIEGYPQYLLDEVLKAYAYIPQRRTWPAAREELDTEDEKLNSLTKQLAGVSVPICTITTECSHVLTIRADGRPIDEELLVPVIHAGGRSHALLDSGSPYTVLSTRVFTPGLFPGLEPGPPELTRDASGNVMSLVGRCPVVVEANGSHGRVMALFSAGLPVDCLIGRDAMSLLRIFTFPAGYNGLRYGRLDADGTLSRVPQITMRGAALVALIRPHMVSVNHTDEMPVVQHPLADPYTFVHEWLEAEGLLHLKGLAPLGCYIPASLDCPFRFEALSASNPNSLIATAIACNTPSVTDTKSATYQAILEICRKTEGLTSEQQEQLRKLCLKYAHIFNAGEKPLTKTNLTKFTVEVANEHRPISCAPRPVSHAKRATIARIVAEGIRDGIIAPSDSEWASAVVLVDKPDGSARLCCDFRPINAITRVPNYPLPRIQQALDVLQGKRYFSVFDLPKAYWQVEIEESSRKYLAFITPDGLFEWTRMPFGAAGAPATQQRMMDKLLAGLKWVCALAYLDDVVIYSDTFEQHLAHLETFFMRCEKGVLQLQPIKSKLCRRHTRYLGFIVSADGVKPDPATTDPIRNFPLPKDKRAVRRFLGIGSYYRRFIRNYARVAAPLQKLIPDTVPFTWGPAQQNAFDAIKKALVDATEMAHPRPGSPFIIDCDAAAEGLGAVLQQRDEHNRDRPICFASRALRPNERKWSATELEAFAIVWALETFRVYIEGSPTLVRTDHSPLLWLRNHVGKSTKIARWVLRLQEFSFDLQHRAGRCNAVADALSRYPQPPDCKEPHETMFDSLCLFIDEAERCQACWGPTRAFLTRGGEKRAKTSHNETQPLTLNVAHERADELIALETDPGPGTSRKMLPPGPASIREAQKWCPETLMLRQYLDKVPGAELPTWVRAGHLKPVLRDGVLCLAKMEPGDDDRPDRIHVPLHLRVPLIQRTHVDKVSGHSGYKKTLAKLKERYLWGTMSTDVAKTLKMCMQCWRYVKGGPKKLPLKSIPKGWPGEIVAMDMFGPLPRTSRGATIILVFIDHFTRWVELIPLKNSAARDVVAALRDVWMPKHGVPVRLLSDNGLHFANQIVCDFCTNTGVRKIFSTPYHPQGNSVVESFMRTLKKALATLVSEDGSDWDRYLPAVALAHNSTPQLATGYSPYFLTHGREALLPVQRYLDEPRLDFTSQRWLMRLWRARVNVYEAQLRLERRIQRAFAKEDTPVPVGALVMVKLTDNDMRDYPFKKLRPKQTGPWVVIERFTNGVTYRVRDLHQGVPRQVTRAQMQVVDIPGKDDDLPEERNLKRVIVPSGTNDEIRLTAVEEREANEPDPAEGEPPLSPDVTEELPVEEAPPPLQECTDEPEPPVVESRYGFRQVADRRARAAAQRMVIEKARAPGRR